MKVSIFGAGYVGLVTGACLADLGHQVICADIDALKIMRLQAGECPIYEPGLNAIIQRNREAGRLTFTTDVAQTVAHGLIQFIAVGTPPEENGSADLQYVVAVAQAIANHMQEYKVVVVKSTVPVGTCKHIRTLIKTELQNRQVDLNFSVASNPEFLKEGAAIQDFMHPDRIVIGTEEEPVRLYFNELYAPFVDKIIFMDVTSAELTKYAANAMLAARISFMNELSHISEKVGANIETVREGIGKDPRIGPGFLRAGCGYGGSCFPKDVRALQQMAKRLNLPTPMLNAIDEVNTQQKNVLLAKLQQHFGDKLYDSTIAIWGVAFKPNTDDIREASSRVLIEGLWKKGANVQVYDPIAMHALKAVYGENKNIVYAANKYAVLSGADALVIVTEWEEFTDVDWTQVKNGLRSPVIIDGRNLFDVKQMQKEAFVYYSIGRPSLGVRDVAYS